MVPTILITGATGTTGSLLVRLLAEQNVPARCFVRNSANASALAASSIEIVEGDLSDQKSISEALAGIDVLFLLTPAGPEQTIWQNNAVEAALKAGTRHIVKLSALGASPDSPVALGRWHGKVEEDIRKSGLGYTFLHPHSFMQNMLGNAATIKQQGVFYGAAGNGKFSMVDVRDIAAIAAVILQDPDAHHEKTYTITGPEALSYADTARILSDVLDRPVQYINLPFDAFRQALLDTGLPEWLADTLVELHTLYASGHSAGVSPAVQEVLGRPATSFDQFARDHVDVFR